MYLASRIFNFPHFNSYNVYGIYLWRNLSTSSCAGRDYAVIERNVVWIRQKHFVTRESNIVCRSKTQNHAKRAARRRVCTHKSNIVFVRKISQRDDDGARLIRNLQKQLTFILASCREFSFALWNLRKLARIWKLNDMRAHARAKWIISVVLLRVRWQR